MKCKVGQVTTYIGAGNAILDMKIKPDTGVIQKFIGSVEPKADKRGRYLYYPLPDNESMNAEPFKSIWKLMFNHASYSDYSAAGIYKYTSLPGIYKFQFYGELTRGSTRDLFYVQEDSPYYNVDVLYTGMTNEDKFQHKILKLFSTNDY